MIIGVLVALVLDARAEAPPSVEATESGGFVRAELLIPAPVAAVRAALADPIASARFSPDIAETTYVAAGECPTLRTRLAGIVSFSYDYRRCATATGWRETLVSSADFDDYEVVWELEPTGNATRVKYAVRIDTVIPAPGFIKSRQMKTSVATVVRRLYQAVTDA